MVAVGETIPDFELPANGGGTISAGDLRGSHTVLYFYPKDNTSGCTTEGQNFRDLHGAFRAAGARIIGASRDSVKSHENFIAKQGFPFDLISDGDETLCRAFEVIKEKSMYGRKYLGIERSTFLIGPDGKLLHEWRKVRVKGHADAVLAKLKELAGG